MADEVESESKKSTSDNEKCSKCNKFIRKTTGLPKMITTNEEASEFNKEYGFVVTVGEIICSSCRSALRLAKSKKKQSESQAQQRQTESNTSSDTITEITSDLPSSSVELVDTTSDKNLEPPKKKAKAIDDTKCISCNQFLRKIGGKSKTIETREEARDVSMKLESHVLIGEVICNGCRSKLRLKKSTINRLEVDQNEEILDLEQSMSQVTVETSSHDNGSSDLSSNVHVSGPSDSQDQSESQSSITSSQITSNTDSTYYESDKEVTEKIELPFSRTISSHAYCFLCGEKDNKQIRDVPFPARLQAFVGSRIFIPKGNRCCEKHLIKNRFYTDELNKIEIFSNVCSIDVEEVKIFLDILPDSNDATLHDAIGDQTLSEERIRALTGYSWDNIRQLEGMIKSMRASTNRNVTQALIIFLMKLRTGNSNNCISAILDIQESVVEKAVNAVLNCFATEILPKNFGFDAYNREFLMNQSSPVAKKLYDLEDRLALICDGTYLRHEKSGNNAYQRKSYSGQKHTHLCKPFTITTTNGFVVEVAGPYNGNMNDAKILKDILNDPQGLSKILKSGDIFILDRGFRDIVDFLENEGYQVYMPALKGKRNQLTSKESNESRFVTKVRWVVEAVHGTIGQKSKLLHHQFSNKLLPQAKTYCKIACFLYNLFCKRLNSDDGDIDLIIERMNVTKDRENTLAEHVEENNWNRKTVIFSRASSKDLLDFPEMTLNDLKLFFTGSYQLSQAISYLAEMLGDDNTLDLDYFKSEPNILRFEVKSRHMNRKTYKCYVHYEPNMVGIGGIKRYCCNCANGNRTVGCCSHVAAVIYYLSHARYLSRIVRPAQQLGNLFDCQEVCPVINEDSDED